MTKKSQDQQVRTDFKIKYVLFLFLSGVTKVTPMSDSEESELQSRVSSAKSIVSSMFAGSEDDDGEQDVDAYSRARKINNYGQVNQ